jgi:hypothetical protein
MPVELKALFLFAVGAIVFWLWNKPETPTGRSGKLPNDRKGKAGPASPEKIDTDNSSDAIFLANEEPTSLFERDRKADYARPIFGKMWSSLFETDREDDLTRPFNYNYDQRMETNLFELDKKDDLTRDHEVFMDKGTTSLFEQDKEHDLTRPFEDDKESMFFK